VRSTRSFAALRMTGTLPGRERLRRPVTNKLARLAAGDADIAFPIPYGMLSSNVPLLKLVMSS
jgi:hypothetical protein